VYLFLVGAKGCGWSTNTNAPDATDEADELIEADWMINLIQLSFIHYLRQLYLLNCSPISKLLQLIIAVPLFPVSLDFILVGPLYFQVVRFAVGPIYWPTATALVINLM